MLTLVARAVIQYDDLVNFTVTELHYAATAGGRYSLFIQRDSETAILITCIDMSINAVTRNSFQRCFLSSLTSLSFLSFPSLSPPLSAWAVAPQIQLRYLGSAVIALPAWKNDICSHQTRSLGSKYAYNAFAAEVCGTLKQM